jgi:hypothetical protein
MFIEVKVTSYEMHYIDDSKLEEVKELMNDGFNIGLIHDITNGVFPVDGTTEMLTVKDNDGEATAELWSGGDLIKDNK